MTALLPYVPIISTVLTVVVAMFLPFIDKKLNVIHQLTNSNLTAANKRLDDMTKQVDIARQEISGLREMLAMERVATLPVQPENGELG